MSEQARYQIVIDAILAKIRNGDFSFDQPICTEKALMDEYGYSRITIRRAMSELENMGVLYRRRGLGSFVSRDIYTQHQNVGLDPIDHVPDKLFAFILPSSISGSGLPTYYQAASEYLLKKGCYTSVFISGDSEERKGRTLLDRLINMNVAGVAYYPITSNIHIDQLNALVFSGRPVVVMDIPSRCPWLPSVVSDNYGGSVMLMEHLISMGHRKIGYIAGSAPDERASVTDRLAGYILSHREHGLPLNGAYMETGLFTARRNAAASVPGSLRARLTDLTRMGVTAVLVENDILAHEVILACQDLGIDVPGRLSVCGFDNSEWATALPSMHLTTVAQDQAAIGRRAAQLLYEGMTVGVKRTEPCVIPVSFIQGDTTAPPTTPPRKNDGSIPFSTNYGGD